MIGYDVGSANWWNLKTRFDPATGCVLYTKPRPDGYMQVTWNGKKTLVHRLAYQQVYGPIEPGLVICHKCDTPNCVNPRHLFAGTQKDNLRDMFRKGRARPQGKPTAPLTEFPAVSYRQVRRGKANHPAVVTELSQQLPKEKSLTNGDISDPIHLPRTILVPSNGDLTGAEALTPIWARVKNVPHVRPTRALVLWDADAQSRDRWLRAVAMVQAPNNTRKVAVGMSRQCTHGSESSR